MALIPENRKEQILAGENITPESREEAFVKEAIDNAGSGGGSLPDTTGASVGDVVTLGADGAEWDAPQKDVVVATLTESGESWATVGITPAEIIAAFEAKKPVYIYITGADTLVPVMSASSDEGSITAGVSLINHNERRSIAALFISDEWLVIVQNEFDPLVLDTEVSGQSVTVGGTINDIKAAVDNYCDVIIRVQGMRLTLVDFTSTENSYRMKFSAFVPKDGGGWTLFGLDFNNAMTATILSQDIAAS